MINEQTNQCNKSIKLCFVALSAYPLLSGRNLGHIIGPDVHTLLLARELIKHNFEITFITYDEGGPPIEHINGIEIIKTYRLRDIDRLNPLSKAFRIWKAMRKVKADIYFHHGGAAGVGSLFCRWMNRRFVCHIGSDVLVNTNLITSKIKEFSRSKFSIGTFGNWLDIKFADVVIVQNEYQVIMLKENFGKDGVLIKKLFPLTKRGMPEKAKPPVVLWVGAMAEVKQPELFLKLAEAIPETRFQMIGGYSPGNQQLYEKLKESSKRVPNFEYLGVIAFDQINEYFSRASILVNTSIFEAYPPYAAIQAWINYTPVVSLGDNPDEIICRYDMGFHSKTFEQLVRHVRILLENEHLRKRMGENGRGYVEKEHDITEIVERYLELFNH